MEVDFKVKTDDSPEASRHKLAKLVLGTAAGFIAKELVEKGYDKLLDRRKNGTSTETTSS